ncbi:hypothetical protein [Amycolatopsis sp. GM8]|uniref:hypothetical protein n=1 Tax=Amycolatopsis sp. GM8 TaxID=2896530 RepID=UPI001F32F7B2|nr:hypothetical protein [Amycolatopsis sp. GM8]
MPISTLPPAPEPYQTLIDEWARSLRAENKSPRTIRTYTDAARWLHIWLADPVAPPEEDDPHAWFAALADPPEEAAGVTKGHVRDWLACRLATTSPGNAIPCTTTTNPRSAPSSPNELPHSKISAESRRPSACTLPRGEVTGRSGTSSDSREEYVHDGCWSGTRTAGPAPG